MGGHKKHKGQQSQSASRKNQQQQPAHKQQLKQHRGDTQTPPPAATEEKPNLLTSLGKARTSLVIVLLPIVLGAVFTRKSFLSLKRNLQESNDDLVVNARRVTTLDDDIMSGNFLLQGSDSEIVSVMQHDGNQQQESFGGQGNDSGSPHNTQIHHHVNVDLRERTVHPTLCNDGFTMGFSDWNTLKAAVQEANAISAEMFLRWNEYFASFADGQPFGVFADGSLYYEEDVIFTICPGAVLKSRKGPVYINAENIILECEFCVIDVRGTHLAFGPHAKNVLVRGITFRGAHTSSLTFYHDGAEASFEDCYWVGNIGNGKIGAVADVNSTSSVSFYRCEIADTKYVPRVGQGRGGQSGVASSLTIRGN